MWNRCAPDNLIMLFAVFYMVVNHSSQILTLMLPQIPTVKTHKVV